MTAQAAAGWVRARAGWCRYALRALAFVTALAACAGPACGSDPSAVYRFYNNRTGTHFYTISAAERDAVVAQYPWFTLEGVAYYAFTAPENGASPVYRFFNKQTGTHFYTISLAERDKVVATYPVFVYEGPVYYAPVGGGDPDTTPLYRFFNTRTGAHFYTTSASERDHVIATWPWFAYEGESYHVYKGVASGATATNQLPKITLALSNAVVTVPASVTLSATGVGDPDGKVTRVSFFQDGAKLVDLALPPYTFTVPITAAGAYNFMAEAADDHGGVTRSAIQRVTAGTRVPVVAASADVWRLLNQATFGATQAEAARVVALGIPGWIDDQFGKPASGYPDSRYNHVQLAQTPDCTTKDPSGVTYPANAPQSICVRDHLTLAMLQRDLFTHAVAASDQLRQRVAWALSQILVVSATEADLSYAYAMSRYQGLMFRHAFGNYRDLLADVSVSPAMGNYLDSVNNDRAAGARVPNENYAREILQLFSIGLTALKPDGTPVLDAAGMPVPTYDQDDIKEYAKIFTGWTYADPANPLADAAQKNKAFYAAPMVPYPTTPTRGHETGAKTLLSGLVAPEGQTIRQDMASAVDSVFRHPNTAPFVSKQLIQRLVTGNPSTGYVQRIAAVFANDGTGVRGNLRAVVRAILLDPEARGPVKSDTAFGSLKEPVLMLTSLIRAVGGVTDGHRLEGAASSLGQRPFYSPTVFNYFPPDATIPGTAILGPEFAIHTSNTAVTRANLVYTLVYSGYAADATVPDAVGTKLNTQQFESLAGDPVALVDRIADVLTAGQLPGAARATIATAVGAVAASDAAARVKMALYLAASSYHFQVQR